MVESLYQGGQGGGGTHNAMLSSTDYLSQAARDLNNIEDGFYISPAFLDKLSIHIAKNFLDLPKIKVPLILGVHLILYSLLYYKQKTSNKFSLLLSVQKLMVSGVKGSLSLQISEQYGFYPLHRIIEAGHLHSGSGRRFVKGDSRCSLCE